MADTEELSDLDRNLLVAVAQNNAATVQQAIGNGSDLNCVSNDDTPLIIASKLGHADIVRILLDAGANARLQIGCGWNAMFVASAYGQLSIVEMLLNHDNGLLEIASDDGHTCLFVAILSQRPEMVQFLVSRSANVHATLSGGITTLMYASTLRNSDIMRLLLDARADPHARDDYQRTALHHAADNGFIGGMRVLTEEHNADVLALDENGSTPFDVAGPAHDVVDCLLQLYGTKVTRDHGRLALHAILRSAKYSFVADDDYDDWHPPLTASVVQIRLPLGTLTPAQLPALLLQYLDTDLIRKREKSGQLPVHLACEANAPVEVLTLLVEMDPVTLHIADLTGSLPLHLLCCNSGTTPTDDASVRYLVEQGGVGTLAARNHKGALPLHNLVASMNPPLRTVQYLIHSFPGAVAEPMNAGPYPFMVAACEASSASLSVVYELVRANPGLLLPR